MRFKVANYSRLEIRLDTLHIEPDMCPNNPDLNLILIIFYLGPCRSESITAGSLTPFIIWLKMGNCWIPNVGYIFWMISASMGFSTLYTVIRRGLELCECLQRVLSCSTEFVNLKFLCKVVSLGSWCMKFVFMFFFLSSFFYLFFLVCICSKRASLAVYPLFIARLLGLSPSFTRRCLAAVNPPHRSQPYLLESSSSSFLF